MQEELRARQFRCLRQSIRNTQNGYVSYFAVTPLRKPISEVKFKRKNWGNMRCYYSATRPGMEPVKLWLSCEGGNSPYTAYFVTIGEQDKVIYFTVCSLFERASNAFDTLSGIFYSGLDENSRWTFTSPYAECQLTNYSTKTYIYQVAQGHYKYSSHWF